MNMSPNEKIGIVTVLYNSSCHLDMFVESILLNKNNIKEVVFVDNNSSDNPKDFLKKMDNIIDYSIIKNKSNIGYSKAVNQGAHNLFAKGYDFIMVTNNDLKIKEGGLGILLDDMIKNKADVIGVPTTNDGKNYKLSCHYDKKLDDFVPDEDVSISKLKEMISISQTVRSAYVQGGIILFNRKFFEKIGFYDDYLFFGGDETDFLMRIRESKIDIKCLISLRAFEYVDHFTRHDGRFKFLKAKMMIQGETYILMKHGYGFFSAKFYKRIKKLYFQLNKGSIIRFFVLVLLTSPSHQKARICLEKLSLLLRQF